MPQKMQRRERSGLPQLAALLTLLVALVVSQSGCRSGPRVETCLPDGVGDNPRLSCYSAKNNYTRDLLASEAINYVCLSSSDYERFLKACRAKNPATVDVCLIDDTTELVCSSGSVISWTDALGFICNSPSDFERVLKWCLR